MNKLMKFENKQFGEIRMVEIENKPYFIASDVAKSLGYKNSREAVKQHCRWVAKHDIPHPQSKNKTLQVNIIPEGDMYRLITNS
ncbi:BRO-N domain-containing protein [Clostridium saudiense]|nr:Bro-N domain-containing protein [Clostridium saudiense]